MSERRVEPEIEELLGLLKEDPKFHKFSVEDFICAIREFVEEDLRKYALGETTDEPPHPLVIDCLEACINHLGDALMAYYASFK
jgi:hypothetical protein